MIPNTQNRQIVGVHLLYTFWTTIFNEFSRETQNVLIFSSTFCIIEVDWTPLNQFLSSRFKIHTIYLYSNVLKEYQSVVCLNADLNLSMNFVSKWAQYFTDSWSLWFPRFVAHTESGSWYWNVPDGNFIEHFKYQWIFNSYEPRHLLNHKFHQYCTLDGGRY